MGKTRINCGRLAGMAGFAIIIMAMSAMMAGLKARPAATASPFGKLQGNWRCVRGGCWLKPVGKKRERVNCRVRYNLSGGGKRLSQSIVCRGSFRMKATARIDMQNNGRLSGDWSSYNNHKGRIYGDVSGIARASRISVGISGSNGYRGGMRAVITSPRRHRVTLFENHNGRRIMIGRLVLRR